MINKITPSLYKSLDTTTLEQPIKIYYVAKDFEPTNEIVHGYKTLVILKIINIL